MQLTTIFIASTIMHVLLMHSCTLTVLSITAPRDTTFLCLTDWSNVNPPRHGDDLSKNREDEAVGQIYYDLYEDEVLVSRDVHALFRRLAT